MRLSHQTRMVLQALLDDPAEESYGYLLCAATGLRPGSLYPILDRLENEGWVTARWEDIDESFESRRRRKYLRLTPDGRQQARAAVANDSQALRALRPNWSPS